MSKPVTCMGCGKELQGSVDTFGSLGHERCWLCYSRYVRMRRVRDRLEYATPEYFEDIKRNGVQSKFL